MTGPEFKTKLKEFGVTQAEFGRMTGNGQRTVNYWAAKKPPPAVSGLLVAAERLDPLRPGEALRGLLARCEESSDGYKEQPTCHE